MTFWLKKADDSLCLDPSGVKLTQSMTPNADDSRPIPRKCIVLIGGPKGYAPWSAEQLGDIVTSLEIPFFKLSFGKTMQFTSVLAAHIQLLDDLGSLREGVCDLMYPNA